MHDNGNITIPHIITITRVGEFRKGTIGVIYGSSGVKISEITTI